MDTVIKTIEEAKTWFDENEGSVTVENSKGVQQECSTLAETEAFLAEGVASSSEEGEEGDE